MQFTLKYSCDRLSTKKTRRYLAAQINARKRLIYACFLHPRFPCACPLLDLDYYWLQIICRPFHAAYNDVQCRNNMYDVRSAVWQLVALKVHKSLQIIVPRNILPWTALIPNILLVMVKWYPVLFITKQNCHLPITISFIVAVLFLLFIYINCLNCYQGCIFCTRFIFFLCCKFFIFFPLVFSSKEGGKGKILKNSYFYSYYPLSCVFF